MKLISEEIESVDILTEEKDGKKTLYIQGPFLQAEVVNPNKRCYPIDTMVTANHLFLRVVLLENSVIQMVHRSTLTAYLIRL